MYCSSNIDIYSEYALELSFHIQIQMLQGCKKDNDVYTVILLAVLLHDQDILNVIYVVKIF